MLYLVATPIGNLLDITLHALEIFKICNYILCEDTRRARNLLNHFNIKKQLISFHKFNERKMEVKVIQDLKEDKQIGLISDAGHPCICDPGTKLVSLCRTQDIPIRIIPGACSITAALSFCGVDPVPFQFLGYIPKKKKEIEHILHRIALYPGISLFFETPHRLLKTLRLMDPFTELIVIRELTKVHEELLQKTAQELTLHFEKTKPKGEIILILLPKMPKHK
jgi:16S rRNA (cytidine1402-2'-O)-methyltransferase